MSSNLEPTNLQAITKASTDSVACVSSAASVESISPLTTGTTGTSAAVKKVKKEKDPNAPKQPLNSYFLFQRDYRPKMRNDYPELAYSEQNKMLSEIWEKMPAEEKAKYVNEAKELYEEYIKEVKDYKGAIGTTAEATIVDTDKNLIATDPISIDPTTLTNDHHFITNSNSNSDLSSSQIDPNAEPPKKKKKKNKNKIEGEISNNVDQ